MFYYKLSKCFILYRKISLTKPREIGKKKQCRAKLFYLFDLTELSSLRKGGKNMLSFVDNINRYD